MSSDAESGKLLAELDELVQTWRQGDVFDASDISPAVFADLSLPLTADSKGAPKKLRRKRRWITLKPLRLAIVSQTCDVVEPVATKPRITLCPVIEVAPDDAVQAAKGWRPHLAPIPAAGANCCVDLTLPQPVEKAVLRKVKIVARLEDDEGTRLFQWVVHRHYSRVAFPDDVEKTLDRFRNRIKEKFKRDTEEGRALRGTSQIRLLSTSGWESDQIHLTVYLVLPDEPGYHVILNDEQRAAGEDAIKKWEELQKTWRATFKPQGVVKSVEIYVATFGTLRGSDFHGSDLWDPAVRASPPMG